MCRACCGLDSIGQVGREVRHLDVGGIDVLGQRLHDRCDQRRTVADRVRRRERDVGTNAVGVSRAQSPGGSRDTVQGKPCLSVDPRGNVLWVHLVGEELDGPGGRRVPPRVTNRWWAPRDESRCATCAESLAQSGERFCVEAGGKLPHALIHDAEPQGVFHPYEEIVVGGQALNRQGRVHRPVRACRSDRHDRVR